MKTLKLLALILLISLTGCAAADQISKGSHVEITGVVSNTPWQHMISIPETHPYSEYIDFDDDQMVVYSKTPINCDGKVELKGEIIEIEGTSKRPGSDERYTELQILVDEFGCISE